MAQTRELTENEGALLAVVLRKEPVSAYQIAKEYDASPIYTFNTAKGKLYPLIERMIRRGLLRSKEVPHDRRGTHLYTSTEAGRSALKEWVRSFRPEHELLPDPLRRKLQAFGLLDAEEQIAWVREARTRIARRLAAVESHDADEEGPFGRFAQDNARESLRMRLDWLDRLEGSLEGS